MGLEGPTGVAAFVGQRAPNDLLRGVGQLVGQRRPPCRLVERADLVGDVHLTIAGERLCIHCPRLGRHSRAAVHEAVADVDPQHVAHRGAHVAGHGLRGWRLGPLALGAHGLGEGAVVGGPEALTPRVGETCTALPGGAAAVTRLVVGGRCRRDDHVHGGGRAGTRLCGLADRQQLLDRRQRHGVRLALVGGDGRELAVLDRRQRRWFLQLRRRITMVGHCRGKYTTERATRRIHLTYVLEPGRTHQHLPGGQSLRERLRGCSQFDRSPACHLQRRQCRPVAARRCGDCWPRRLSGRDRPCIPGR